MKHLKKGKHGFESVESKAGSSVVAKPHLSLTLAPQCFSISLVLLFYAGLDYIIARGEMRTRVLCARIACSSARTYATEVVTFIYTYVREDLMALYYTEIAAKTWISLSKGTKILLYGKLELWPFSCNIFVLK